MGGAGEGGGGATSENGVGPNRNHNKEGEIDEQSGDDVFFVDGNGRVTARGGLEAGPIGNLVAKGGLVSEGSTVFERKRAVRDRAGPGASRKGGGASTIENGGEGEVEVDASLGTFFEVPDDGREGSANVLRIKVSCRGLGGLAGICCWSCGMFVEPWVNFVDLWR